jgi:hypothetical protein
LNGTKVKILSQHQKVNNKDLVILLSLFVIKIWIMSINIVDILKWIVGKFVDFVDKAVGFVDNLFRRYVF